MAPALHFDHDFESDSCAALQKGKSDIQVALFKDVPLKFRQEIWNENVFVSCLDHSIRAALHIPYLRWLK